MDGIGLTLLLYVVLFAVLIGSMVLLVRWVIRLLRSFGGGQRVTLSSEAVSARETLDQRYARGELSRGEYLQARRDLGE